MPGWTRFKVLVLRCFSGAFLKLGEPMKWKNGNDLVLAKRKDGTPLVLTANQRSMHMHVPGGSGSGKTRFLEHLIRQDVKNWRRSKCGVLVVDPTGSLYDNLMMWLTANQHIYTRPIVPIDLRRDDWVTGYNVLRKRKDAQPDVVASALTEAIAFVWGRSGTNETPRFSRIASTVLQGLYESNRPIADAHQLLSYEASELRAELADALANDAVANNLRNLNAASKKDFHSSVESTINGFERIVKNSLLKTTFSLPHASFDCRRALDEGWIVIASLSHGGGKLFQEDTHTFGTLLLADLWNAAYDRGKENARWQPKPFYLYIDEFQNFLTPTIAANLEEARGYGLHLTLAHQGPSQLLDVHPHMGERIYNTVMSQTATKVVFRNQSVAAKDGPALAQWLFKGTVNLQRVKQEIFQTKVMGTKEETRTIKSKAKSDTESSSHGTGRSTGGGSASGSVFSAGNVLTTAYDSEGVANPYPTEAETSGNSFSEVFSRMEMDSEMDTEGYGSAKSEGESIVPVFLPVYGKELASREFMSKDDQLFEAEQAIFRLQAREALARCEGSQVPIAIRTPEIRPPLPTAKRVEEFRIKCLKVWDFAVPREEALRLIQKAAIPVLRPTFDEDDSYETVVRTGDMIKKHGNEEGEEP